VKSHLAVILLVAGISIASVFAFISSPNVLEAQQAPDSSVLKFHGILDVVKYDANGNEVSHDKYLNRVVDQGEDFLIDQSFKEGTAGETTDADQLASICVSAQVSFVDTSETKTAANFDTDDGLSTTNCIADSSVTQTGQTAVIGAETFSAGTHVPNDTTITGIGICQGSASTPFTNCADAQGASSGIMFAQINISDVTLATGETVQITYTLDLSSSGT